MRQFLTISIQKLDSTQQLKLLNSNIQTPIFSKFSSPEAMSINIKNQKQRISEFNRQVNSGQLHSDQLLQKKLSEIDKALEKIDMEIESARTVVQESSVEKRKDPKDEQKLNELQELEKKITEESNQQQAKLGKLLSDIENVGKSNHSNVIPDDKHSNQELQEELDSLQQECKKFQERINDLDYEDYKVQFHGKNLSIRCKADFTFEFVSVQ